MRTPRFKHVKLIVLEFVQWCAFASVVFVTSQKLALIKPGQYSVLIAGSVGYVAGATLMIWIPIKLFFQWMKILPVSQGSWCPSVLVYVLLGVLPCCIISLVGMSLDEAADFESVCAELMVIMIVIVDVTEKMKHYKMRSAADSSNKESANAERARKRRQEYSIVSSTSSYEEEPERFAWSDPRSLELLESMLNAYDVRLILGFRTKNGEDLYWDWKLVIYIVTFMALTSFIFTKKFKYKFLATVVLLDVPVFFLRLVVICVFGYVTDALFLLKNIFSFSLCIYFCVLRPFFFKEVEQIGPVTVIKTIDYSTQNGVQRDRDSFYDHETSGEYYDRARANDYDDTQLHHEAYSNNVYYAHEHQQNEPEYLQSYHVDDTSRQQHNDAIQMQPHDNQGIFSQENANTASSSSHTSIRYSSNSSRKQSSPRRNAPQPPMIPKQSSSEIIQENEETSFPDPPEDSSLPFPPPPENAPDEETVDYTVGPHRVSMRKDRMYTPDIASKLAMEAIHQVSENQNESDVDSLDVEL